MLEYYGLGAKGELVREWYDGYCFGKSKIYNPWNVAKYVKELSSNEEGLPAPFWANTSSNSIVRTLVEQADNTVKEEIEDLIAGKGIEKPIHEDITYEDISRSEDNLWNFLFFTGYILELTGNNHMKSYRILSNRESGDGRPDLILRTPSVRGKAIIIERKAVDKLSDLEGGCEAALHQIEDKRYEASLKDEGYETIIKYGVCFYKKECLVKAGI